MLAFPPLPQILKSEPLYGCQPEFLPIFCSCWIIPESTGRKQCNVEWMKERVADGGRLLLEALKVYLPSRWGFSLQRGIGSVRAAVRSQDAESEDKGRTRVQRGSQRRLVKQVRAPRPRVVSDSSPLRPRWLGSRHQGRVVKNSCSLVTVGQTFTSLAFFPCRTIAALLSTKR